MAKSIEPIEIKWGNNVVNTLTSLDVRIVQDNLLDSCNLVYQLLNEFNNPVSSGNIVITGDDYQTWDGNNNYPYQFVANALNLTLIQE